jgi:hypothetical protein
MNDKIKTRADYAPNEKKVWRPESATQVIVPEGSNLAKDRIYFIAVEELQGAWVDDEWEEADSSESWTETTTDSYIDKDGYEHKVVTVKDFHKDIPRSRRYVLKEFTDSGFAKNAYSSGFSGPRQYKN